MKKIISILVAIAVMVSAIHYCAAAADSISEFDIKVTDAENGIVTVSGTIDKTNSVNTTVGVVVIDKAAGDGNVYTLSDYEAHTVGIAYASVEYGTGKFSCSIGMGSCESGVYQVYALLGGNASNKAFHYISQSDVEAVIDDIKSGAVAKENLFKTVSNINNGLGSDLTAFADERGINIFNKRLDQGRGRIESQSSSTKISSLKSIIDGINAEFSYVVSFEKANVWTDIGTLLANTAYTGIDITKYNALSDSGKAAVCKKLMGVHFADGDEIKSAYDSAISGLSSSGTGGSGSDGSSGSKGGMSMPSFDTGVTPNTPETRYVFNDIDSVPWAADAITQLYLKGIVSGDGSGGFAPNDYVTREQFAKMIVMTLGIYDENAVCTFDDGAGGWYSPYIASLVNSGIVNGIGNNLFGVGQMITREDMAVMAHNALKFSNYELTVSKESFSDFDTVSDYAKEAVSLLAGDGIINGTDDGKFAHSDNTTRAEAAVVINSIMGRIS